MPTFIQAGDGTKTTFACANSALPKTVRIDGVPVTPASDNGSSITLAAAPSRGNIVEIFYGPFNGADPLTVPFTLISRVVPLITPVVRYQGPGSETTPYTVDPNARRMNIYVGYVTSDY